MASLRRGAPVTLPPKGRVVIGIDLGTTFSCASIVENGRARVLPSRLATNTIPSVVLLDPGGKRIVGWPAAKQLTKNPGHTISGSKRLLGRSYDSPVVAEVKRRYAYEVVEDAAGEAAIKIADTVYSLEEIASMILVEIRESASLQIRGVVNRAVITCPAFYNERQREAVLRAGQRAGFHVERVLSEPTAAALHFGFGKQHDNRVLLVYDLGGGTFDVSLLNVDGNDYRVIATGGDTFLGGMDFDQVAAVYLAGEIAKKTRIDPRIDKNAMARLLEFAEKAKRELSTEPTTLVRIDHLVVADRAAISVSVELKREVLEKLWQPLVDRTIELCQEVVARANVEIGGIQDVLLVGGQTRTPIVRAGVKRFFGKDPRIGVNPDEAVALGAAQFAASLEAGGGSLNLVDALPMSIGVALPGGRFKRIIERDARLPAQRTYHIHTSRDDQSEIVVAVRQGESERASENELLGKIRIGDLPKGPKRSVSVKLEFDVDTDCSVTLTGTEARTKRRVKVQLGGPEDRRESDDPPGPFRALVDWLKRLLSFGAAP
jgi:molecular chaperone DnaK